MTAPGQRPDLIRVVSHPKDPDVLGVVNREKGGLIVLWSDGSAEQVDPYDNLGPPHGKVEGGQVVYPWVTRVSHEPVHCERILAWHKAARAAWTPDREEAERWGQ
jgi:hypothetical protein